jgi:hypothetical protein
MAIHEEWALKHKCLASAWGEWESKVKSIEINLGTNIV